MHRFFRKGTTQQGVRHNHQTLPGLACLFGGRYFKVGYGLPEAAEWIEAAKKLFDSQKVSHKPQCDCNSYEWGTLHQTGWWSLGSGDYAFFDNGAARVAADRAILEMDNRGYSSCNGDFWSLRYFPATFNLAWSDDHLKVIARIERGVLQGGLFALAMPRGGGKTSLCIVAALWAVLVGHREFVCVIGTERGSLPGEGLYRTGPQTYTKQGRSIDDPLH